MFRVFWPVPPIAGNATLLAGPHTGCISSTHPATGGERMPCAADRFKALIEANAQEIVRLNARIKDTFAHRGESAEQESAWRSACADFHARYDALAFPGGLDGAFDRLLAGDPDTMEATVCFLGSAAVFLSLGLHVRCVLAHGEARAAHRGPA